MKKTALFSFVAAMIGIMATTCGGLNTDEDPIVMVYTQSGTLTAGVPGTASYLVLTANINNASTGTVQWYSDEAGTSTMGAPEGVTTSLSTGNDERNFTVNTTAASPTGTYYFVLTIAGTQSNVARLTIGATTAKSILLDPQVGTLVAGTAGNVLFPVTTANIDIALPGSALWYSNSGGTTSTTAPSGISASVVTASGNRVLTITATTSTEAGTYYLRISIDGVLSNVAVLTIDPAPVKTVTLGTQAGTLTVGIQGSVTFSVTTENIDNAQTGTVQCYTDVSGTNQTSLPTGIEASVSTGSATRTLTFTKTATAQAAGDYYFRVVIDGTQSGVGTLVIGSAPINIAEIGGLTPPVAGAAPVTAVTETAQYTGTVTWSPIVSGEFDFDTEYTATITLTPKQGYTLTGVAANFFTVAGARNVTNSANSGVVTAAFPATDAEPLIVVDIKEISGLTPPSGGGTPTSSITETEQFTGTVTWQPPVSGTFDYGTEYTAIITLKPKQGYTFEGVATDFFNIPGANSVTFDPDKGTITAVFPPTGTAPLTVINIAAIEGVTPPVAGAMPVTRITDTEQYTGVVMWQPTFSGTFDYNTQYTAVIILNPKEGYTYEGVAANFFTVAGAISVTNDANGRQIRAVFPATDAAPPTVIDIPSIAGVTPPAGGATPVTSITETEQFSGTVTWQPPVSGTFDYDTEYTAIITLTPKEGYTLEGLAPDFFNIPGANSITFDSDKGTITVVFPPTGATPPTVINIAAIAGVTPPVATEPAVYAITETEQYTGTVTWSPMVGNAFDYGTIYTATITLTAKQGYTLTGVAANFFIVAGARSVTHNANSGVITALFPATGDAPLTVIDISAIAGVTPPVAGATPVTSIAPTAQYTGEIKWSPIVANTFDYSTEYIATISLTPRQGYTLEGVAAHFFTVAGATSVSNDANSGVVTALFAKTEDAPLTVIDISSIAGVTPPAGGATPVTSITETEQFSGTVRWEPPVSGTFDYNTSYTAIITLTPKEGYTLEGLAPDFFNIPGANSIIFDSDKGTITVVFPPTGATPPTVINISAIVGVTPPVATEPAVNSITETAQYTGTVTWEPFVVDTFDYGTIYTATITLTAKQGFTLTGVAANFFTVAGATSVTNGPNSGVITAVFAKTGDAPLDVINIAAIEGVTPPIATETAVNVITETNQYSGTVTWSPDVVDTFGYGTVYTATITLTAKQGYTLEGVAANFFTVTGATPVTNGANSGVITAVFPATEPQPTITVGEQLGQLFEYEPGKVTFPVTTEHISITAQASITWFAESGSAAGDIYGPAGASASVNNGSVNRTMTVEAGEYAEAGTYYFKVSIGGVVSNMGTLIVLPAIVKTVDVSEQEGTLSEGQAGNVKFPITTENVDISKLKTVEWVTANGASTGAPAGISTQFIPTGETTLDLEMTGTTNTVMGHYFFLVSVDDIYSDIAKLIIDESPLTVINIAAIDGVTPPVATETAVNAITETNQYTGTVTWEPFVVDTFDYSTVYTATITLTPRQGYTLTGVAADFFTVAGATSVSNDANSGVITAVFWETGPRTTINIAAIPGITQPVAGATAETPNIETTQFTCSFGWYPSVLDTFDYGTEYWAIITLLPKEGYTLEGVAANFFTVEGADVTHAANSGEIAAVFPATGPAPLTVINISEISGITQPVAGATAETPNIETTQFTCSFEWYPSVLGTFDYGTEYWAIITLLPKEGYTLEGVAANFFTVEGAVVTHAANSGEIAAVFPKTGVAPVPSIFVDSQTETLRAGVAGETKFYVSTIDIDPSEDLTVKWYTDANGTIPANGAPAGISTYIHFLTITNRNLEVTATTATVMGDYYFRVTLDDIESNVETLTIEKGVTKSVEVGRQEYPLTAGVADQTKFYVTTQNIAALAPEDIQWFEDANGTLPANDAPPGISTRFIPNGDDTRTLEVGATTATIMGDYFFRVAIDGATSDVAILQIDKGVTKSVYIGTQSENLTAGEAAQTKFTVTTTGIAASATEDIQWFTDANGENQANGEPAGITYQFFSTGDDTRTLEVTASTATIMGDYYFTVTIDGETSNVAILQIDKGVTKLVEVGEQGGPLSAGVAGEIKFYITTENIATSETGDVAWFADSEGTVPAINAPSGIRTEVSTGYEVRSLYVTATTATVKGDYFFRVTIDGETSNVGTLTITNPRVTVGEQEGQPLVQGVGGKVSFSVLIEDIPDSQAGKIQWYGDANGSQTAGAPSDTNTELEEKGDNRTLWVETGNQTPPGDYYFSVIINDIESNIEKLTIIAKTVTIDEQEGSLLVGETNVAGFFLTIQHFSQEPIVNTVEWFTGIDGITPAYDPSGIEILFQFKGVEFGYLSFKTLDPYKLVAGVYYFRVTLDGVESNNVGVLTIDPPVRTITVGEQEGQLTAGEIGEVTFPVTTANIPTSEEMKIKWFADENGNVGIYSPEGTNVFINDGTENRTMKVEAGKDSEAGTYYFQFFIEGVLSNMGTLTIDPAPTKSVTVGPQTGGDVVDRTGGTAIYEVTTTGIHEDEEVDLVWFTDDSGTQSMSSRPQDINFLDFGIVSTGINSRTLTMRIGPGSADGTYYFKVVIDNTESNLQTLTIIRQ